MPAFTETIVVIFALIALGYGSIRIGLLKPQTGDGIADFVFSVALPLLLFRTLAHAEFDHGPPYLLWTVYFTAVLLTWTTAHFLLRTFFGRDVRGGVVAGLTASFSNLVLVGIPFFSGIYGEAGLAVVSQIISIHLPIMLAASILAFDYGMRRDGQAERAVSFSVMSKGFLRQLFGNPLIIGILAGIAVRLSGLAIPGTVDRLILSLSSVAGPLALFSIGISLYGYGIRGQVGSSLVLVALKMVVMPAAALALSLILGLPAIAAKVAVVAASLPAGTNTWLVATRFGTGQRLTSTSITIGTALAAVTTGVWLLIVETVL